ncbi:MAG: hypothetical protein U9N40_08000 [Euryarchaeota archaeon]|nr:hypothetical protein [Euryarchaeota archaeon]
MILEERIAFNEENAALEFIDWLKDSDCRGKKTEIFEYFTDDVIRGSIDTIDRWCSEMSLKDEDQASLYLNLKKNNLYLKDAMQIILKGRSAGDILYSHKDMKISKLEVLLKLTGNLEKLTGNPETEIPDYSSERFNNAIFKKLPLSLIHIFIRDSDCIFESEDGFTLSREISPGEIINEISIESLYLPDWVEFPELCNIYNCIPGINYEVTFSMPSYIHLDPQGLASVLSQLGVNAKKTEDYVDTFSLKKDIVLKILEIIKENKVISIEELKGKLNGAWMDGENEWGYSNLIIDIIETQQFVSELRNAGYITGHEQKLKILSKPGRRRRH